MRTIEPVYGIEVECAYNSELLGDLENQRHGSSLGRYEFADSFFSEDDSSLGPSGKFDETAELISIPFQLNKVDKIISDFKSATYERIAAYKKITVFKAKQLYKLKDIFSFNKTCGCHVHITPLISMRSKSYLIRYKGHVFKFNGIPLEFKPYATPKLFDTITDRVYSKIKRSVPRVFKSFKSHYYRDSYSSKTDSLYEAYHDRGCFNFGPPGNAHFEYRGFNLYGVKTWDEFSKVIKSGLTAVKEVFNKEFKNGECAKVIRIKLPKRLGG
jgi:hypothetical protein